MTEKEILDRYGIPDYVLDEYRETGLCNAVCNALGDWCYDDSDLERLGMMSALHDMGFKKEEAERYMKLSASGESSTCCERIEMLDKRRKCALDEIHLKEKQLEKMDYLRNEIRKNKGGK